MNNTLIIDKELQTVIYAVNAEVIQRMPKEKIASYLTEVQNGLRNCFPLNYNILVIQNSDISVIHKK